MSRNIASRRHPGDATAQAAKTKRPTTSSSSCSLCPALCCGRTGRRSLEKIKAGHSADMNPDEYNRAVRPPDGWTVYEVQSSALENLDLAA